MCSVVEYKVEDKARLSKAIELNLRHSRVRFPVTWAMCGAAGISIFQISTDYLISPSDNGSKRKIRDKY